MAGCGCWPPDRSPPRRFGMVCRTGNIAKKSAGMRRSLGGRGAKPVSRFLAHGQPRENVATVRHLFASAVRLADALSLERMSVVGTKRRVAPSRPESGVGGPADPLELLRSEAHRGLGATSALLIRLVRHHIPFCRAASLAIAPRL